MDNTDFQNLVLSELKYIRTKLDEHDKKFAEYDQKFDTLITELKGIFNTIDKRFNEIDKKFDEIDKRFIALESKFDKKFIELENKFDNLSNEVGSLTRCFFNFETNINEKVEFLVTENQHHNDKSLLLEKQFCNLQNSLNNSILRISALEKTN